MTLYIVLLHTTCLLCLLLLFNPGLMPLSINFSRLFIIIVIFFITQTFIIYPTEDYYCHCWHICRPLYEKMLVVFIYPHIGNPVSKCFNIFQLFWRVFLYKVLFYLDIMLYFISIYNLQIFCRLFDNDVN